MPTWQPCSCGHGHWGYGESLDTSAEAEESPTHPAPLPHIHSLMVLDFPAALGKLETAMFLADHILGRVAVVETMASMWLKALGGGNLTPSFASSEGWTYCVSMTVLAPSGSDKVKNLAAVVLKATASALCWPLAAGGVQSTDFSSKPGPGGLLILSIPRCAVGVGKPTFSGPQFICEAGASLSACLWNHGKKCAAVHVKCSEQLWQATGTQPHRLSHTK